MRRTASEILRDLEIRVARLERQASKKYPVSQTPSRDEFYDFGELVEENRMKKLRKLFIHNPPLLEKMANLVEHHLGSRERQSFLQAVSDLDQRTLYKIYDKLLDLDYGELNTKEDQEAGKLERELRDIQDGWFDPTHPYYQP